jgi:uncharacterized protein YggE
MTKYFLLALSVLLLSCKDEKKIRQIQVVGEGKVRVMPNQVTLTLSISFTRPRMVDAVRETQVTTDSVTNILKRYSTEPTDIKTSSISANKDYDYSRNEPRFIGFEASETMNFVLNDISKFTELTGELLATRINSISGIQFGHSNADSLFREADLLAYDDALKSANKLCSRAKVKLGKLLYLSNTGSADGYSPDDNYAYSGIRTYNKGYGGSGFKISPDVIEYRRTIASVYEVTE